MIQHPSTKKHGLWLTTFSHCQTYPDVASSFDDIHSAPSTLCNVIAAAPMSTNSRKPSVHFWIKWPILRQYLLDS